MTARANAHIELHDSVWTYIFHLLSELPESADVAHSYEYDLESCRALALCCRYTAAAWKRFRQQQERPYLYAIARGMALRSACLVLQARPAVFAPFLALAGGGLESALPYIAHSVDKLYGTADSHDPRWCMRESVQNCSERIQFESGRPTCVGQFDAATYAIALVRRLEYDFFPQQRPLTPLLAEQLTDFAAAAHAELTQLLCAPLCDESLPELTSLCNVTCYPDYRGRTGSLPPCRDNRLIRVIERAERLRTLVRATTSLPIDKDDFLWLPRELFDKRFSMHTLLSAERWLPNELTDCVAAVHDCWHSVQVYLAQTMLATEVLRGGRRTRDPVPDTVATRYGLIVSSVSVASAADTLIYGPQPPDPRHATQRELLAFYARQQAALLEDSVYLHVALPYIQRMDLNAPILARKLFTTAEAIGAGLRRVWDGITQERLCSGDHSATLRIDASSVGLPNLVAYSAPRDPIIRLHHEQVEFAFMVGAPVCSISPMGRPWSGSRDALCAPPVGFYFNWYRTARLNPTADAIAFSVFLVGRDGRAPTVGAGCCTDLAPPPVLYKCVAIRVLTLFEQLADAATYGALVAMPPRAAKRARRAASVD